jgi:ATP-dependent Clp protease ATP-binding subunit ClpA
VIHLEAGDLRERLRARMVGQDHAVDALVRAVTIGRSGLREPDRPLAGLLFAGPTVILGSTLITWRMPSVRPSRIWSGLEAAPP